MSDKQETQTQTGIRLSDSLLGRVDKLVERMSEPGLQLTRADILRLAVFRGVEQLEAEKKKR
jgi:predicted DNA-binding protein